MTNFDYYTCSGFALELLAKSKYHKQFGLADYFKMEILPPIWAEQVKFYISPNGSPTAMITWARLDEEVEKDVIKTGRVLQQYEWNCGTNLFFNDWITPYNNIREIMHDMTHKVFPNEVATSLRRNTDSSVRRVNRWTGANVRKIKEELEIQQ
jgi:cytolysin-activating lysine-acyltransferase